MGIQLTVEPKQILVDLTGIDGLLAIKRHLQISTHLITGVESMLRKALPPGDGTWLRAPGTHVPGLIRHGSYGRAPHREFWAVFRSKRVLVITVRDWDYARVILGIHDPETHAAAIATAIS
jgi:hypothetical protein